MTSLSVVTRRAIIMFLFCGPWCRCRAALSLMEPRRVDARRRHQPRRTAGGTDVSRRQWYMATALVVVAVVVPATSASARQADCFADCFKNCKAIAPQNPAYCQSECRDYCDQPDRQDGLSGSVSAERGEVGILGGTFGTGTVVKGQDKPPSIQLPGLDFSDKGERK
jgi:hypothetical protein